MEPLRGFYRLAALSLIALFCSATPLDAQPPSREQPRFGGVLKVAMLGEPPSLDPHWTTTFATWGSMWHVFETLYTLDKDWSPFPTSPMATRCPTEGASTRSRCARASGSTTAKR